MIEKNKSGKTWIFILYLALAVVMTWPLAKSFRRYPLFDQLDSSATIYNFWWQYYSMFDLHISPWFNPMINYPDGYSMVLFPLYLSYGIFSWPLQAVFGTPQAIPGFFNWISILSFALSGFLGFLLFEQITGSRRAGLVSGILFSFIPFHYWHLPRCHTSCLELFLLPIYFYFRLLEKRGVKPGVYFGLALVPIIYQSPNYVIYLTMFFGLHFIYSLILSRSLLDRAWWKGIAAAVVTAAVLGGPLLYEIGKEMANKTMPATSTLQEQNLYSANLLGFVIPGPNQTIYKPLAELGGKAVIPIGSSGKEIFPGYLLLLCAVFGIFLARKHIRQYGFWILALVSFMVLSLGPYLNAASKTFYQIPPPYFFLRKVFPFFEIDRSPVRVVIFGLLALAVFSAGFFKWLEQKLTGKKVGLVFIAIASLAVIELNQAPIKVERVELPELYQKIAAEPGPFTILELPLLPDIYRLSGFFQPGHKKNLAISLTARKIGVGAGDDPLFSYLDEPLRFFNLAPETQERVKNQMKVELRRREIKYVIVFLRFVDDDKKGQIERLAGMLSPVKSFDSSGIFRVYQFDHREK